MELIHNLSPCFCTRQQALLLFPLFMLLIVLLPFALLPFSCTPIHPSPSSPLLPPENTCSAAANKSQTSPTMAEPLPPNPSVKPTTALYDLHDSPFLELRNPITALEICRIIFLLPLAILRSFIGCSALCVIAAVNTFAAYNHPIDQPLAPWRRSIILASKELVVIVFWMLGFLNIHVRGRENIALAIQLKGVVIFNHVAWLDAFALVWLMAPSGVAKAFNAHLPVIKHAIRALQTVYLPDVPRRKRAPTAASRPVVTALASSASAEANTVPLLSADFNETSSAEEELSKQVLEATLIQGSDTVGRVQQQKEGTEEATVAAVAVPPPGMTEVLLRRVNDPRYCEVGGFPIVVMAPEAVCSSGRSLLEFRTGAFVLGRPVLPVLLQYRNTSFNPA